MYRYERRLKSPLRGGAGAISFIVEETLVSVSAVLALFSETEVSATGAGAISFIVEETLVSDRPKPFPRTTDTMPMGLIY